MISTLLNSIIILFSFSATGAVLIHDTNADKALVKAVSSNTNTPSANVAPGADPHTHVHNATSHKEGRDLRNGTPRVLPKGSTNRSYALRKATRGDHPFDDHLLPVAS